MSKNRLKLEIDRKQSSMFNFLANLFSKNSGQYITTILVGNNIALVIYSLYMSLLINGAAKALGWEFLQGSVLLETAISTIIIIFVAEFLPKSIFKHNPNFYFKLLSPVIYIFYIILYPVAKLTTLLSQLLLFIFGRKSNEPLTAPLFDRTDLMSLLDNSSTEVQHDAENEIKLFQNALDFADLRVRDCMTPRVDIEAVDIATATIEDITERFAQTKFSRLFVWSGSIDNIVGYVNSKSLFRSPKTIKDIMREVNFVPESMPLNDMLLSLIKYKSNIAVVIDEFGGTAGVISLEDVLEEIFGEIEDEHDETEMIEKQVGDDEYVLSCRLDVDYLNERYDLGLEESNDYDTLAGFIIYHYEGIPAAGESVTFGNFEFKILRTTRSRIELARVKVFRVK